MSLGLSSLGRLESRVLATLDAVLAALGALAGDGADSRPFPTRRQFFRGESRLLRNAHELFGPEAHDRPGRIMVTLGAEAADDPAVIAGLVQRGADAVRINCAHDRPRDWTQMVAHVRAAESRAGRRIAILMDIAGPKVRTGEVMTPPDRARLAAGDTVLLARRLVSSCRGPLPDDLHLPRGARSGQAAATRSRSTTASCRGSIVGEEHGGFLVRIERGIESGVKLKPEKGLNFPTTELGLDPLTDKDRQDLDFIVRHADLIGYSFVETAAHVAALRDELAHRTPDWRRHRHRRQDRNAASPSAISRRSSSRPPASSPSP